MKIDIQTTEQQGVTVFDVAGRVDSITAVSLGEQFQQAFKQGQSRFVLDLTQTEYVSSAGLREILSALQDARKHQGNLVLVNPTQRVMDLLKMSGLVKELKIFPTQVEAVQSFA